MLTDHIKIADMRRNKHACVCCCEKTAMEGAKSETQGTFWATYLVIEVKNASTVDLKQYPA